MSDADWRPIVRAFVERRIDERTFHDRFFDLWNAVSKDRGSVPSAIDELFYVVEAYCPDPALRDPDSPFEADDIELRKAAEKALIKLPHRSRIRMLLSRMKP